MKINVDFRKRSRGYVSYLMVLSLGVVMIMMMVASYNASVTSQDVSKVTTLRIDYAEKEEEILRSIVNLVPNRAIMAMRSGSDDSEAARQAVRWKTLFSEALDQANARTSVDSNLKTQFGLDDTFQATAGDSAYGNILTTFDPIEPDPHSWDVSPGTGRIMGAGFPAPLDSANSTVLSRDKLYPIISREKVYRNRAQSHLGLPVDEHPEFNLIPYPNIRFGYAEPGQPFVAKRNWWAFSLDLAEDDDGRTGVDNMERDFVVSVFEIPSQLAISAEAFAVLGKHADGSAWENAVVEGGVFATRARIEEGMTLSRISGRRGIEIDETTAVGNMQAGSSPFAPGVRERFEVDHDVFMPVSLASEAGRAAFFPINRGASFFDRHAHSPETDVLSSTTWDDYSVGAKQCAMRLDITDTVDQYNPMPTALRFEYLKGGSHQVLDIRLDENPSDSALPAGYIRCAVEGETVNFPYPVDVAYGRDGSFYYESAASGDVQFTNARFGDPLVGSLKFGYYRPSYPFKVALLQDEKWCVEVYPERMKGFLETVGADDPSVNHSLVVNVAYPGHAYLEQPSIPCTELDYGVVLKECADLSEFDNGFSLVTNLRLYIADDFNTVAVPPPLDSGIPSPYYPPSSLFAPEKRYGAEIDPFKLSISGQVGNLAGDSGGGGDSAVHLLDLKTGSDVDVAHSNIAVHLSQIRHPSALPPVTMMNWLVMVEERRAELYVTQDP